MLQPPFIQLTGISKIFNKNIVLEDLNLSVGYGEILGIIGKSGSGKTTLLNIIIGFLKPDKGSVIFQSRNIHKDEINVDTQFGFASQEFSFYDKLTVDENLRYFGSLYKIKDKTLDQRIPELLKFVDLEDKRNLLASNLSTGMKKRLDIACSLIHDPKILILDEPTSDLDTFLRRDIIALLKKINKEKEVTIVLTSHLLDELDICNRIAILNNKQIVATGSSDELKEKCSNNMEIILEIASGNYGYLQKMYKSDDRVSKSLVKDGKFILYTSKSETILRELLSEINSHGDKLLDVDVNKPSLNEVFEYFVNASNEKAIVTKKEDKIKKKNDKDTGDNKEES